MRKNKIDYRQDIEDLIDAQNKRTPCPFDNPECEYVDSCDDVLGSQAGFDIAEGGSCPRSNRVTSG